ncbi:MAG: hypothetical protein ACRDJU_08330 [Actinomycetota bacterium]
MTTAATKPRGSRLTVYTPFDLGFLVGAGLSILLYLFIGQGGFPLAARSGGREHYYTAAALSLLHGHLYVPEAFIASECFLVHGRCYGYFGITPSLLRLPAVLFTGSSATSSDGFEAAFYVLGFVTAALGLWWLARQLVELWAPSLWRSRAWVVGFLLSVAGLGATPLIFLVGRPLVYEEAILWGVAFALVGLAAVVSVYRRPRTLTVAVLIAADILAALARPTVGYTAVLATLVVGILFVWFPQWLDLAPSRPPRRWGWYLIVGAFIALLSAPAVIFAKFGTFGVPYKDSISVQAQPDQLKALSHPLGIDPAVLPTKLFSVLRPDSLDLLRHPPYVELGELTPTLLPPATPVDVNGTWERTSSLTATLPFSAAALVASLVVVGLALKRWRGTSTRNPALLITALVLVSAAGAMFMELLYPGETYRYIGDWLPLLAIGGSVGCAAVAAGLPCPARGRAAPIAVVACALLLLASQAVIQTAVAIENALVNGGERPAPCAGPADPYGSLGRTFCSSGLVVFPPGAS